MLLGVLIGGLGNQMFQVCALMSHALTYQTPYMFLKTATSMRYTDTMFTAIDAHFANVATHNLSYLQYKEPHFHYKNLPLPINNRIMRIDGYFQSYKYFLNNEDTIWKILGIREKQQEVYNEFAGLLHDRFKKSIAMHFRIGDYKKFPRHHPILSVDYYINALQQILSEIQTDPDSWTIKYCCQRGDKEEVATYIHRLKKTFPQVKFEKVDDNFSDWKQMLIMSLCQHNIIANSTFSWWSAYLNMNREKIVIYPKTWFGVALTHHRTIDLFPTEWHVI